MTRSNEHGIEFLNQMPITSFSRLHPPQPRSQGFSLEGKSPGNEVAPSYSSLSRLSRLLRMISL